MTGEFRAALARTKRMSRIELEERVAELESENATLHACIAEDQIEMDRLRNELTVEHARRGTWT